jgi:hypothetical protein
MLAHKFGRSMDDTNSSAQLEEPLLAGAQEADHNGSGGFQDDTGQDPGAGPLQDAAEKGVDLVKNGANEEADLYRM